MNRCVALAGIGAGFVAPNPMVGAVLVHDGKTIGEGYHQVFGGPHAEVNCLNSVDEAERHLIPQSTLYVSLEPCTHFGKTPPCADRIIKEGIRHVVIGARDPFHAVNGSGIDKLKAEGIKVELGILEQPCTDLNRRFFTFHTRQRPYIILKWAQTADGKVADASIGKVNISKPLTNRLVHRWRSEETSIMVGSGTAMADNPSLTTRLWPGKNPVRLLIDRFGRVPASFKIFSNDSPTFVFSLRSDLDLPHATVITIGESKFLEHLLHELHSMQLLSVMVEGGPSLQRLFLEQGLWDEIRVITNPEMVLPGGLPAPLLELGIPADYFRVETDEVRVYYNR